MLSLTPISYKDLNHRQKENYNFQKLASKLAEYGFNCIRLSDDYQGADFLACHKDGDILKVQLKGRLTIAKKYEKARLFIAFPYQDKWYIYDHNTIMKKITESRPSLASSQSWDQEFGQYSWRQPPKEILGWLQTL